MAAVAVLSIGLAVQAPTSAALEAPSAGYGFSQYGGDVRLSQQTLDRELDAVAKTNATWLRVVVDWFRVEPVEGLYDWSYIDGVVNSARAHGLKVLMMVAFAPDWARAPGTSWSAPPQNAADFGDFATAAVGRYGTRVSSWEIWNEPNSSDYFGSTGDAAAKYTDLLKAAYTAIKKVQPGATIVSAGMSRTGEIPPATFLSQMYASGAKGYFDATAMHPYVSPGGLDADSYGGWSAVGQMHGVMAAEGDGAKQIWMTELGAPTMPAPDGVTQDEQAKQITDVLAAAAATGYSGPAFIFTIRDGDGMAADPEGNYGALLTNDWQPKVAARVLSR
ncbi:hypothetical protein GCM10023114_18470 [Mycolicibacterium sediminis]|uniref:Glycosyl hydrolases family 39 N-terminal catalytic domain-containing protein n=1 Tax=Mycolicibacterium sediminis TaxID=1286180 RepID=A0A7I7QQP1_9MYCO|nr:hypothetical protein MSEDJ_27200 [Mycolicibacterium sediminis]